MDDADDSDDGVSSMRVTNLKYAWTLKKKAKSVKQPQKKRKLNPKRKKRNHDMRRIDSYFSPNTMRNIVRSTSEITESSDSTVADLLPSKPLYTPRIINEQKKNSLLQNSTNIPFDNQKEPYVETQPQISNQSQKVSFSSVLSLNTGQYNDCNDADGYDDENCNNLWCDEFAPQESKKLLDFGNS